MQCHDHVEEGCVGGVVVQAVEAQRGRINLVGRPPAVDRVLSGQAWVRWKEVRRGPRVAASRGTEFYQRLRCGLQLGTHFEEDRGYVEAVPRVLSGRHDSGGGSTILEIQLGNSAATAGLRWASG